MMINAREIVCRWWRRRWFETKGGAEGAKLRKKWDGGRRERARKTEFKIGW